MAKLPKLKESTRLAQGGAVQATTGAGGVLVGREQQRLGDAISKFGGALAKAIKADDDNNLTLLKTEIDTMTRNAANKSSQEAITNESDVDGARTIENFDKGLKEVKDFIAKNYSGKELRTAQAQFGKRRAEFTGMLHKAAITKRGAYTTKRIDTHYSTSQGNVIASPDSFNKEVEEFTKTVNELKFDVDPITGETTKADANMKKKYLDSFMKEATMNQIKGYMLSKDDPANWAKAESVATTSTHIPGDKKADVVKMIRDRQVEEWSLSNKRLRLERSEKELKRKESSERILGEMSRIMNYGTEAQKIEVLSEIEFSVAQGGMTKPDASYLRNSHNNVMKDIDDGYYMELKGDLISGKTQNFIKRVQDLAVSDRLKRSSADSLINAFIRDKKKRNTTGYASSKKRAETMFKMKFKPNPITGRITGVPAGQVISVMNLAGQFEDRGMLPHKAMYKALRQIYGKQGVVRYNFTYGTKDIKSKKDAKDAYRSEKNKFRRKLDKSQSDFKDYGKKTKELFNNIMLMDSIPDEDK